MSAWDKYVNAVGKAAPDPVYDGHQPSSSYCDGVGGDYLPQHYGCRVCSFCTMSGCSKFLSHCRGPDPVIPPTVQPGYHIPTEQEVKDGTVNLELMKACFVELPKDKQVELYEWIYRTFDHCRIYA